MHTQTGLVTNSAVTSIHEIKPSQRFISAILNNSADSQRITEHSPNSNSTLIFKSKSRRIIKVQAQLSSTRTIVG